MQNTPTPDLGTLRSRPAANAVTRTALLAASFILIPVVLGLLFVFAHHRLSPASAWRSADTTSVTNRPDDATATNLAQLVLLRRDLRNKGLPVDDVNLRIWAAQAAEPAKLFNVPPPEAGKKWNWHLSQDGRYATAVAVQPDTLGRRAVGLYDLVPEKWLWKKTLPWPDAHESPYVFDLHTVLRYTKNAKRFAMEIGPEGQITSLDRLPDSSAALPQPKVLSPQPAFPGEPVASRNGVFFVVDAFHQNLIGYAQEPLPALRYAGKGDANTLFSGNGLLKFTVRDGRVTVSDSLTQTVLQQTDAWPNNTNTVVTGALTTHDGSQLSVFLKTDFGGAPAVTREWSVSLALYTGTVIKSFNADALLAKPHRALQRQALSPDGQWQVSVTPANELLFTSQLEKREVARLSLSKSLGLQKPLDHLAFLEEGRHLVLRQGDNFWLLDFAAARGYADLLARTAANAQAAALPPVRTASPALLVERETPSPPTDATRPASPSATRGGETLSSRIAADPFLPAAYSYAETLNASIPSSLALRAEWFADNQAWYYAAALLEEAHKLQQYDYRAPRVNPLLQARCLLLAGQRQKARFTCREALGALVSDQTEYNRMALYHLQGLLFSKP